MSMSKRSGARRRGLPHHHSLLITLSALSTQHSALVTQHCLLSESQIAVRECFDPYMPENILVVEYEPRYTDRVRQALAGQPFAPSFAKDGEEALRALEAPAHPRLIVLSSVVPKVS